MTSTFKHVGLIPDGARRWARENAKPLSVTYTMTMEKLGLYIGFLFDRGIRSVSVYLASADNLKTRAKEEVEEFIKAEIFLCKEILPDLTATYSCKVIAASVFRILPEAYASELKTLEANTSTNQNHRLYLLAGYDPIAELRCAWEKSACSDNLIPHLWVTELVDAVIRTGGVQRLSDFLPLQCGYAELVFLKKHFLDTTTEDLAKVLESLEDRQRRFGG